VLATLPESEPVSYQTAPSKRAMQILAFRRQGREFAIPMSAVREMTTVDDVVPSESDTCLRGVCTIEDTVVPVLDLVRHTSIAIWESSAQLIIVSSGSQRIGLVYDQIVEICPVHVSEIEAPSPFDDSDQPSIELEHGQATYLDPDNLFESPESALLDSVSGAIAYELVG
jgi:chemotaxis signal transduction protein